MRAAPVLVAFLLGSCAVDAIGQPRTSVSENGRPGPSLRMETPCLCARA
jgi:hypothetical protein